MMELHVQTSKPYRIEIERGLLNQLGSRCAALFPLGAKALVVSDSNVAPLYGEQAAASLRNAGFSADFFSFPAGEQSKRLAVIEQIYAALAERHFTRSDFLVALGGGVTGDMTGFAAATYLRGVPFVQIPTSLLAQVDSSVGGKTGVDLPQGKNLVGAFHQPRLVLIDPDTLSTLPPRFLADGMGEVIKYGCIKNRALFDRLEKGPQLAQQQMESILFDCVDCKRAIVEADEFDTGERMLLNFGHTFGHALEKRYQFTTYTHGEAVGAGMVLAARLGERLGVTKAGTAQRLAAVLTQYRLPTQDGAPVDELVETTLLDKKNRNGKLSLILLRDIGESLIYPITHAQLKQLTEEMV